MTGKHLAIGLAALACGGFVQAQRLSIDASLRTTDKPYIEAVGNATISAKPDQAIIEIGVVTQATTAAAAASQNAKQTDAVIVDLRKLQGKEDKLKTTNYSIRPSFQNPKPGASPTITGYIATNTVELTLNNLAEVPTAIDSATHSGANLIQRLQYRLKDPHAVRMQALREAAAQARQSADAIALGLGSKVVRVLSAAEGTSEESFVMAKRPALMAPEIGTPVPATPIEAGMIDVEATVTIRVEIAQ